MTPLSLSYRPLDASELQSAADLMNSMYARKKIPAYFHWLYYASPYPSVLYGVFDSQHLIGMTGVVVRRLLNDTPIGILTDILIKDTYQRRGIGKKLLKTTMQHFSPKVWCSFTNQHGMLALTQGMNWDVVTKIDTLCRQTNYAATHISRNMTNWNKESRSYVGTFHLSAEDRIWRFEQHPIHSYTAHQHNSSFLYSKYFTDPATKHSFLDLVYGRDEELITSITENTPPTRQSTLTTWCLPHLSEFRMFQELGFTIQQAERYLCVLVDDQKYLHLHDEESWNIFQSDSEVY